MKGLGYNSNSFYFLNLCNHKRRAENVTSTLKCNKIKQTVSYWKQTKCWCC